MTSLRAFVIKDGNQQLIRNTDDLLVGTGVDASVAGPLSIGTSTANAITIGKAGVTTSFPGPVELTGDVTTVGGTTFQTNATFEGNVTFGDAATDLVTFVSKVNSDIAFNAPGYKITNLANGVNPGDAVNNSQLSGAVNVGNTFVAVGNGTGIAGSANLAWSGTDFDVTGAVNIKGGDPRALVIKDITDATDILFFDAAAEALTVQSSVAASVTTIDAVQVNISDTGHTAQLSVAAGTSVKLDLYVPVASAVVPSIVAADGAATPVPLKLDASEIDVNSVKIVNVANGTNPNDAVNFSQLSAIVSGVSSVSATAPLLSSGGATPDISIDTAGVNNGDVLTYNGAAWAAAAPANVNVGNTFVAVGDGTGIVGSAALTFDGGTTELLVGGGTAHNIKIAPLGAFNNPLIEADVSMNINIADFGGALGMQTGGVDLVLVGGDDGGGMSYLQTQDGVRLETKGQFWMKEAVVPASVTGTGKLAASSANSALYFVNGAATSTTYLLTPNSIESGFPTTGAITFDLSPSLTPYKQVGPLTGDISFASVTNLGPARGITVEILGDTVSRNITSVPGDWTWLGGAAPTVVPANATVILSLACFGPAQADIVASWSYDGSVNVTDVTASAPLSSSGGTTPDISLTGTVPVANGGTGTSTAFTQGSVVFAGASGVYSQDNANLFWDDSNNRLGIGTAPSTALHVNSGAVNGTAIATLQNTAGDFQIFRVDANPEGSVTGSIGDIADDSTNGVVYVKTSGSATNTGWSPLASLGTKVFLVVEGGQYSTIQAAIDATPTGTNTVPAYSVILVGPKANTGGGGSGTWGPATLAANKSLMIAGLGGAQTNKDIRIDSLTFDSSAAGLNANLNENYISGLYITSSSASSIVTYSGTGAIRLKLNNCYVVNTGAGDAVTNTNSSVNGSLYLDRCILSAASSTGIALKNSGNTYVQNRTEITTSGGGLAAATGRAISTSGGNVFLYDSLVEATAPRAAVELTGGSAYVEATFSRIQNFDNTATATAVTAAAGTNFGAGFVSLIVGSSVAALGSNVAGAGAFTYGNVSFGYVPTLTVTTQNAAFSTAPWLTTAMKQGVSLTSPGSGLFQLNSSGRLTRYNDAAPTNGQVLIGDTTAGYWKAATISAGSGVSITNGAGSITIAATGTGGTVTSVDVSGGTTGLTTSGGPITGSGTITLAGTLAVANGGTGVTSLGTGSVAALQVNVGSAGAFVVQGGALGTPSSGTLTNATGLPIDAGTTGTLPVSRGGSGATTLTGYLSGNGTSAFTASATIPGADISGDISGNAANVNGTVAVANGGTGATTLAANAVVLGNGTSAVQTVAPGTSGNVLTSNGTTWQSVAPIDFSTVALNTATNSVPQGDACYVSAANTVNKAIADGTLVATARVAGIASATSNRVSVLGIVEDCNFESSLTLAVGDSVFLSPTSAGKLTNVSPSAGPSIVAEVGIITAVNTAGGGAAAADVLWQPKSIIIL